MGPRPPIFDTEIRRIRLIATNTTAVSHKSEPNSAETTVNDKQSHFNSAIFFAASARAFVMTLSSVTLAPFWRLLSSAASMKA